MGGITTAAVEDYIYSILPPRDEVLAEMEAEAAKHKVPIVGPAVGRLLYQLALMTNAKTGNHDPNADSPRKVSIFRTAVHNASCTTFSASCPSPSTASTFISLPRVVGGNVVFICR